MKEFGQQIRNAMHGPRSELERINSLMNSPLAAAGAASLATTLAAGARQNEVGVAPAAPAGVDSGARPVGTHSSFTSEPYYFTGASPTVQPSTRSVAMQRVGVLAGCWDNPCVAAAMPALLILERMRGQYDEDEVAIRAQLVREVQHFEQTLLKQQRLPEDVRRLSYLLCTFIDGASAELKERGVAPLNLLIAFHRDSWGGEKSFSDLENYMQEPRQPIEILGFYYLILSLGFKGKYHILERGEVLLADLFLRLHSMLFDSAPAWSMAPVRPQVVVRKRSGLSPGRLLCVGSLLFLLAWGGISFYLHDKSRAIRNAIVAWEPPAPRKINIMETLPQPLPAILSEGWLEARPDPRGWLLLFTSDGAFRTGKSMLSAEFVQKRNIERLGEALAGWPGDLEVIGHTDNSPFRNSKLKDPNLTLSQERAERVADKLSEGTHVNSKYQRTITAVGKGDAEPIADNSTDEGRRKNRRVDILWKVGDRSGGASDLSSPQRDETPALLNTHSSAGGSH
ncbi:type IVB secretion system protein IcmH/DotU [Enterobacter asburiae]|uniref:type IVB secretion system protein IcmH/DotU n=1 Tax=Scandinavium sp. UTDF21-P1B TaxID=3446379 RepID=UPI003487612E